MPIIEVDKLIIRIHPMEAKIRGINPARGTITMAPEAMMATTKRAISQKDITGTETEKTGIHSQEGIPRPPMASIQT
jgi:uncharacterized protein (DUF2147 family)